jgi:hypothetical protein
MRLLQLMREKDYRYNQCHDTKPNDSSVNGIERNDSKITMSMMIVIAMTLI